ncbi:hypothetical protein UCDDS831_g07972 [Diplodia seriata]|uniref:Uncharacterized protein n=1 Tax=Diplodia seriata TaxID=420778 RepID=A0A0G2DXD4_9PEZI|nr:hypothetical protein UCDDS831_g07972 [Diplodia seriata]
MLPNSTHTVSHTNRTAVATVDRPVELLQMNAIAVWLSIAILIWLIITTIVVVALQRRYLRNLKRNVECIADVLVLIAGSDRLLRLVRGRELDVEWDDAGEIKTKLGWFENGEGQRRWGIEIVDEEREEEQV